MSPNLLLIIVSRSGATKIIPESEKSSYWSDKLLTRGTGKWLTAFPDCRWWWPQLDWLSCHIGPLMQLIPEWMVRTGLFFTPFDARHTAAMTAKSGKPLQNSSRSAWGGHWPLFRVSEPCALRKGQYWAARSSAIQRQPTVPRRVPADLLCCQNLPKL